MGATNGERLEAQIFKGKMRFNLGMILNFFRDPSGYENRSDSKVIGPFDVRGKLIANKTSSFALESSCSFFEQGCERLSQVGKFRTASSQERF